MRGQDDGDALRLERAHELPHVLSQHDVDACGGLIEKEDLRLVRQRLRDEQAALHPAGERDDLAVFLVPQRQILEHLFEVRGIGPLAEQPATERHRSPHGFEGVGRQLLRHEADHRARGTVVGDDVVTVYRNGSVGRIDDPADGADEGRLSRAVGAQQREDLAAANVQVYFLERLETGSEGLGEIRYGDDCLHGSAGGYWRAISYMLGCLHRPFAMIAVSPVISELKSRC